MGNLNLKNGPNTDMDNTMTIKKNVNSNEDGKIKRRKKSANKCKASHMCNYCEKVFRSNSDAKRHEVSHTKTKHHCCEECGKQFSYKSDMLRHRDTQHSEDSNLKRSVTCSECGKTFTNKTNLVIHERTHTGNKPFVCEICECQFRLECHLEKHRVKEHNHTYPHICDLCGKGFIKFKFKRAWAFHKKKCGSEKIISIKKQSCEICKKEFHKQDAHTRHMKSHLNQKDFQCELCSKSFADKRNLVSHTNKKHTNS